MFKSSNIFPKRALSQLGSGGCTLHPVQQWFPKFGARTLGGAQCRCRGGEGSGMDE